jgi:IS30 family transposase
VQARGVLKRELISRLRTRRLMRRGKASTTRGQPRGQIVDAVSIRERPAEVEDRAIPGHWEGDLLAGGKNSHIATLVERQSRFVVLVQVPGKDTESVVDALVRQVKHLPARLMSSLTWDCGTELADHKRFTVATNVNVYFCDTKSAWQRGAAMKTPTGCCVSTFPKGQT